MSSSRGLAKDDPCRSPVDPCDAEWQADEVVATGAHARQVEPFDDADPGGEERSVRLGACVRSPDRQVVDPDGAYPSLGQPSRSLRHQAGVVGAKPLLLPVPRVAGLEENSVTGTDVLPLDVTRPDPSDVAEIENAG